MLSTVASKGPMVMVSETQNRNLNDSPLQSLQFPTMTVSQNIGIKKLKIKITTRKTEVGSEKESRFVSQSCDDQKIYADDSLKVRLPLRGSKHGPPAMVDLQKEKRQKLDRTVKQQCGNILKTLMSHPTGWVFNKPVDPVALCIPDYFTIISEPMDLGTIKMKLERNVYFTIEEFAADVRLTFSNAMLYNPPSNSVHVMAKELDNIFSTRWKLLEGKLNRDVKKVEVGDVKKVEVGAKNNVESRLVRDSLEAKPAKAEPAKMPQNERPLIGKVIIKGTVSGNRSACGGSVNSKKPLNLVNSKCGSCNTTTCQCSIKHDSATAASSDLSLERSVAHGLSASKVGSEAKSMLKSCARKSNSDCDGGVSASSELENISLTIPLSLPTTTAAGEEGWSEPIDLQLSPKKALRAAMLKSRFAGTILKAKHKALLDQGDKIDPVKMQQEQERLERQQQEEKARIEAQIRAAEAASRLKAEAELKMKREREREAARIALQKMKKTVEFDNLEILKEIERLRKCPLPENMMNDEEDSPQSVLDLGKMERNGVLLCGNNPLESLGLFIKDEEEEEDYMEEDINVVKEVVLNGEEGEIF